MTPATRRAGRAWRRPDVAAFDPIFWFFHANWDRLWWEWQKIMQATAYWTFRSTIFGSPAFLQAPLNTLSPFTETADMTIDLTATGVDYAPPAAPGPVHRTFRRPRSAASSPPGTSGRGPAPRSR